MSSASPVCRSLVPSVIVLSRAGVAIALAGGIAMSSACGPAASQAGQAHASGAPSSSDDDTSVDASGAAHFVSHAESVFEVSGMRCSSCADRIVAELEKIEGVHDVAFSEARATFAVEHDARRVDSGALESRIESLGYEAVLRAPLAPPRPPAVKISH